jgi:hypothetical protein
VPSSHEELYEAFSQVNMTGNIPKGAIAVLNANGQEAFPTLAIGALRETKGGSERRTQEDAQMTDQLNNSNDLQRIPLWIPPDQTGMRYISRSLDDTQALLTLNIKCEGANSVQSRFAFDTGSLRQGLGQ